MRALKKTKTISATRCRTLVVRAQGNTRCSETRAPEITTMTGTRAPGSQTTRCRTLVVRAQGNTCCSETRAPGNTTVETRAPYNFVLITTGILQTTTMTPRSHARHRVRRCPLSMVLTLPNLGLGSYSSRPSRAIRAGQQGTGCPPGLLANRTGRKLANWYDARTAG